VNIRDLPDGYQPQRIVFILYSTFDKLKKKNRITIVESPYTLEDALELAKYNKFEFEKWLCGEIGASGMFQSPGERGADG